MNLTAKTPKPPYYAVIFTSQRTEADNGYAEMAKRMEELALKQEGFLGIESARDDELGITVSYWDSLEAIKNWKNNISHQIAQKRGKEEWYQNYHVRISKVERDYFASKD
ncbi:antibiotic biosynthesis monooxygenase family protein [Rummeliibacillus pycnus]|uniref:antibiotic biosynthesis monooxygenase family protein n=1 Tax=Rummeliibacillus pycnus TaxID=101070 RepID=UPI003D2CAB35